jgi:hypothetical protein
MKRLQQRTAIIVASVSLGALPLASARAEPVSIPISVLKQCTEINEPAKRLACYDQVAERPAAASAAMPKDSPKAKDSAAPPPKESFGLYNAEHPTAPAVEALITGKVIAIGISNSGRATVTLEGNEVWELDSADPVLAKGDAVTVKRGTLGSFILTTPTGRLHRVHRLR